MIKGQFRGETNINPHSQLLPHLLRGSVIRRWKTVSYHYFIDLLFEEDQSAEIFQSETIGSYYVTSCERLLKRYVHYFKIKPIPNKQEINIGI